MNPETVLLAVSLALVALSALGLWLLRRDGWLTARIDAALAEPPR